MKFTAFETVIEKLVKEFNYEINLINEYNDKLDIFLKSKFGEPLQVTIYSDNRVKFVTNLDYRQTFDAEDIEFFNSINVIYWKIYKHWIEFAVDVKDENEFETVTCKVIDNYFN